MEQMVDEEDTEQFHYLKRIPVRTRRSPHHSLITRGVSKRDCL